MTVFNLLLLLALLTLVQSEFFALPIPFLAKQSRLSQNFLTNTAINFRGGSAYEKDEDEEEALDEWDEEEEYDEVGVDVVLTDGPETTFDDEEEDFEQEFNEEEKKVFDDLEEHEVEPPLTQVLEERMATTTTDDESSAFVDRMELADAYDDVDTTADQEDTSLAAVTAATAIGAGGSDPEDASEEASVEATEITDSMKKSLIKELKYKAREVKFMRPDIAVTILEKNLQRPPEGIPPSWYIEGAKLDTLGLRENVIKVSVALVALGGMAVLGLKADKLQDTVGGILASIPASLKSLLPSKKSTPAITVPRKEEQTVEEEEEKEEEEDHPQSVKPYSDTAPSYEDDLDKTWLDKGITKISNGIKGFFRIKI